MWKKLEVSYLVRIFVVENDEDAHARPIERFHWHSLNRIFAGRVCEKRPAPSLPTDKNKHMEATVLNPTQMHLLKLFAFNNSEEYAREIQMVLTRHFQAQLDAEADRLWDEGILNQEKLDEIRQEDLHAK